MQKQRLKAMVDAMQKDKYVAVIGAANVDLIGTAFDPIVQEDSNPGRIHLCPGGVGRNIAENIARLDVGVKLVAALGGDAFGRIIALQSEAAGIDMSYCHIVQGAASSAYMAILDSDGEMKLALSDMRIADELPADAIGHHKEMIECAELIVLDANLTKPIIEYTLDTFPDKRMTIDPVSIGKAKHMKDLVGRFDTIKMNRMEAEYLSGIPINSEDDLRRAGEFFLEKGTRRIFITRGSEGAFYQTADESGICDSPHFEPANATGAGDAFTAGVAYSTMQGYDISYTVRFACAMARVALKSTSTVSPDMSVRRVMEEIEGGCCFE